MKNRESVNGQLQLELPVFIAYACIIFEGFYIAQVSELYNYRKNIMKWKANVCSMEVLEKFFIMKYNKNRKREFE